LNRLYEVAKFFSETGLAETGNKFGMEGVGSKIKQICIVLRMGDRSYRDTDDTDVNGIKKNIMKKNIEQDGFILVKRKTKHTRKYVEPTNEQNVAKDKRIVSWSLT
jgi:hypothetical protein